jgi:hypothetical protein
VSFEDAFLPPRTLVLEETQQALISSPVMVADPAGGILLVDVNEDYFMRYDSEGHLLWFFGGTGEGPEEFEDANKIARVSPTQVFLGTRYGKSLVWDEERRQTIQYRATPPLSETNESVLHLGSSQVLLHSPVRAAAQALHVYDFASDSVVASFFTPPVSEITRQAVQSGSGRSQSALRGDTIATVFSFSDTIYLHDRTGRALEKIAFPSGFFALPRETPEAAGSLGTWLRRGAEATKIYWMHDGTFVVEYSRVTGGDQRKERSFLGIRRSGEGLFDLHGFDSILQLVDDEGNFYFADPSLPTRSTLLVTRLRLPS